jgi:hypothetical protein
MTGAENVRVREAAGGVVLAVKVVAGSSRDKVAGVMGDRLKVATAAAPEKGKANAAVAETLAALFGVPKRQVRLLSGTARPTKDFLLEGLTADGVRAALRKA